MKHPIITILVVLQCILAWALPLKHNPDANVHYLTVIQLLSQNWSQSIDGIQSPLLAWLAFPLATLGVPIPWAFRIISVLIYGATLMGVQKLSASHQLSRLEQGLALLVVGLITSYPAVRLITSDLLAACVTVWCLATLGSTPHLRRDSACWLFTLLFGLSYYAKAIQFLILIPVTFLTFTPRRAMLTTLTALAICAPWCIALSLKYGTPVFSAQQLIISRKIPIEYSPHNVPGVESANRIGQTPLTSLSITETLISRINLIKLSSSFLIQLLKDAVFGSFDILIIFALFVLIGASKTCRNSRILIGCGFFQIITYGLIWGPYPRYLYPALAPLVILAVIGASQLNRKLTPLLIGVLLLGIGKANVNALSDDWTTTDPVIYTTLANLPSIKNNSGPIAGGSYLDQNAPLAAYLNGRPLWLYMDHHLFKAPDAIQSVLQRENITQILSVNYDAEALLQVPGVEPQEQGTIKNVPYTLWKVVPRD